MRFPRSNFPCVSFAYLAPNLLRSLFAQPIPFAGFARVLQQKDHRGNQRDDEEHDSVMQHDGPFRNEPMSVPRRGVAKTSLRPRICLIRGKQCARVPR